MDKVNTTSLRILVLATWRSFRRLKEGDQAQGGAHAAANLIKLLRTDLSSQILPFPIGSSRGAYLIKPVDRHHRKHVALCPNHGTRR